MVTVTARLPQPFVWLETTFIDGQWEKNNVLLLQSETKFYWNSEDEVECNAFLDSIQIFYPSKVI